MNILVVNAHAMHIGMKDIQKKAIVLTLGVGQLLRNLL